MTHAQIQCIHDDQIQRIYDDTDLFIVKFSCKIENRENEVSIIGSVFI